MEGFKLNEYCLCPLAVSMSVGMRVETQLDPMEVTVEKDILDHIGIPARECGSRARGVCCPSGVAKLAGPGPRAARG